MAFRGCDDNSEFHGTIDNLYLLDHSEECENFFLEQKQCWLELLLLRLHKALFPRKRKKRKGRGHGSNGYHIRTSKRTKFWQFVLKKIKRYPAGRALKMDHPQRVLAHQILKTKEIFQNHIYF